MSHVERAQLNVRSAFAKARANEIAKETGMTVVQVVEDALRAYTPPVSEANVGSLIRCGPVLVLPAKGRRVVTLEEANEALETAREREP